MNIIKVSWNDKSKRWELTGKDIFKQFYSQPLAELEAQKLAKKTGSKVFLQHPRISNPEWFA